MRYTLCLLFAFKRTVFNLNKNTQYGSLHIISSCKADLFNCSAHHGQSLIEWSSWWRHQMEKISVLLALCEVNGEFISQRPVTRSFDVFFDLLLNRRLNKQPIRRWFETPSRSLWRHCNWIMYFVVLYFLLNIFVTPGQFAGCASFIFPDRFTGTWVNWFQRLRNNSEVMGSGDLHRSTTKHDATRGLCIRAEIHCTKELCVVTILEASVLHQFIIDKNHKVNRNTKQISSIKIGFATIYKTVTG